jgi:hypothetical protein
MGTEASTKKKPNKNIERERLKKKISVYGQRILASRNRFKSAHTPLTQTVAAMIDLKL